MMVYSLMCVRVRWLTLLLVLTGKHTVYIKPMDYVSGTHRGFCFVEFAEADDADEAIFNMDGADLLGRTISVSVAQANQVHRLGSSGGDGAATTTEAVWKSDEWFQNHVSGKNSENDGNQVARNQRLADAKTLQEA
jgi:RNA recognition motif-containing protein